MIPKAQVHSWVRCASRRKLADLDGADLVLIGRPGRRCVWLVGIRLEEEGGVALPFQRRRFSASESGSAPGDMLAEGHSIAPDCALTSHVAPLGMTFYTADSLPPAYRGGAFVGEHGSWNRDRFNGYKGVFVPFKNGRPEGKAQDVVTGFLNDREEARGRPVGVAIGRSGALLIADDAGGVVWRVTSAQ